MWIGALLIAALCSWAHVPPLDTLGIVVVSWISCTGVYKA